MVINSESIIGKIVAENYKAASVFKSYNIDFCCNGNRSIAAASKEKNIDENLILQQLSEVLDKKGDSEIDFKSWSIDLLADYIEKKHHRYVRAKTAEITPYLAKIADVHGDRHPELYEIKELFAQSAADLSAHMIKEENILFPLIREMVDKKARGEKLTRPPFGSIENPIKAMQIEHDNEGVRFRRISELSNNYETPQDGCNTYRVTLNLLKEFEDDLHRHIHLENNILFPAAIEFERDIY
ncbi:MAG TPA: iron-sulfur cluster repair di-iron protein [Petrimonas sp.]|uniref:iron-sulfur cluster repair di-iron protein n=1 Tax=Petrimonas sp. TaxID=2023866 RepID=UPI0017619581|nr:iron-sulfur cluster repair di-iron protein [Petrimonas sp.]MEA4948531.1 iron-sulfur cluster repair di-iron protein [Petrimonas sp.]HHV84674.1 iron-sulfur cluster repair di-iron protein [Petrimonas sp.]